MGSKTSLNFPPYFFLFYNKPCIKSKTRYKFNKINQYFKSLVQSFVMSFVVYISYSFRNWLWPDLGWAKIISEQMIAPHWSEKFEREIPEAFKSRSVLYRLTFMIWSQLTIAGEKKSLFAGHLVDSIYLTWSTIIIA